MNFSFNLTETAVASLSAMGGDFPWCAQLSCGSPTWSAPKLLMMNTPSFSASAVGQALCSGLYFAMRLVRKTFFPRSIPARLARWIPFFGTTAGVCSTAGVVGLYDQHLRARNPSWLSGQRVLEVGIGATNASCYEMAARGAARCHGLEPFVPLDVVQDRLQLEACAASHRLSVASLSGCVERLRSLNELEDQCVDLILSNSVLEHVEDPAALASELWRVLRPGGRMLHVVDYRDHFFSFPYHHLLWSKSVWQRFLNPGDLSRWRLSDHVEALRAARFDVTVLQARPIPAEFEKVRARIHHEFSGYTEQDLRTAFGAIEAIKESVPQPG